MGSLGCHFIASRTLAGELFSMIAAATSRA
jgi:hypothetical protein